jgi:Zn-dependent protease
MVILLAHEMGHYLYCRHYGVAATLPFFIPFPTLIGTLGAFIRIRSPIRSRSVLFDIGIAGPIAGFLVALPVLMLALGLSKPMTGGAVLSDSSFVPGFPLIFKVVHSALVKAGLSGSIAHLPLDQVCLHPTAMAAWVGMFATALNLLPGGQLDGGHIVFSLAPRAHKTVSRLTILALIPMAIYFWTGWLIWAILLRLSGMRHPMVEEWIGISAARRWLAVFGLIMLILTLTPAPFGHFSLLDTLREFRTAHKRILEYPCSDLLGRFAAGRLLRHNQASSFNSDLGQMPAEHCRAPNAGDSTRRNCEWCSDAVGQRASEQCAKRSHAHEHHGVNRHNSSPQMIGHHGLDQRVGR